MALVDTLDTVLMCRVYAWRGQAEGRRAIYNLVITLISLGAAAAVAVVELGPLVWGDGSFGALSQSISFISEHFSAVGGCILAVFLTVWAVARLLQKRAPSQI